MSAKKFQAFFSHNEMRDSPLADLQAFRIQFLLVKVGLLIDMSKGNALAIEKTQFIPYTRDLQRVGIIQRAGCLIRLKGKGKRTIMSV